MIESSAWQDGMLRSGVKMAALASCACACGMRILCMEGPWVRILDTAVGGCEPRGGGVEGDPPQIPRVWGREVECRIGISITLTKTELCEGLTAADERARRA